MYWKRRPVAYAFILMHNEYMKKSATLTVRIPPSLKEAMGIKAHKENRSLSAQIEYELMQLNTKKSRPRVRLMGRFPGPVPTDEQFEQARRRLWSRLEAAGDSNS